MKYILVYTLYTSNYCYYCFAGSLVMMNKSITYKSSSCMRAVLHLSK